VTFEFRQKSFDYYKKSNKVWYPITAKARQCILEDFGRADNAEEMFNIWDGYSLFCPDIDVSKNDFTISGEPMSNVGSNWEFVVNKCK